MPASDPAQNPPLQSTAPAEPIPHIEGRVTERPPWWRCPEVVAAALAIVAFAVSLPGGYVFDDVLIVQRSGRVHAPGKWREVWTTDHWYEMQQHDDERDRLYRPVELSSYRIIAQLFGPSPLPQRVCNLLLHALVSVLVVRSARRLGRSEVVAFVAGALFAVLPIHTEVVASVVGRSDLLATAGLLTALLAHDRFAREKGERASALWMIAATAAVFVAAGAKESALLAPAVIFTWDFLRTGNRTRESATGFEPESRRENVGSRLARSVIRTIPSAVAVGLVLWLRWNALDGQLFHDAPLTKTINVMADAPTWQRMLGVVQLFGMYWAKTVWPAVLTIKYSINDVRLATSILDPHVLIGALAAAALALVSMIRLRKGQSDALLLTLFIVLTWLPTSNAFFLIKVFFAERAWYLPSVGVCVLAAILLARFARSTAIVWTIWVIVCAMALRSAMRAGEWRNNGVLFAAAYRDAPDSVGALQLYGDWLATHGRPDEAIPLLQRAIEIDLGYTDAYRSLGHALLEMGEPQSALFYLQRAEMHQPGDPRTAHLMSRARKEVAEQVDPRLNQLRAAAADSADDLSAQIALVRGLREAGRTEDALDHLLAVELRFQNDAAFRLELAVAFVVSGDIDSGIAQYESLLALDPTNAAGTVELAMLLLERREGDDLDRANELSLRALELQPGQANVLICRAEVLGVKGDLDAAAELYRRAIESLPEDAPLRRVLVQRLRALGG